MCNLPDISAPWQMPALAEPLPPIPAALGAAVTGCEHSQVGSQEEGPAAIQRLCDSTCPFQDCGCAHSLGVQRTPEPPDQPTARLEIDTVPIPPSCCCWQAGSEGLLRTQAEENCSHLNKHSQLLPADLVPQQRVHVPGRFPRAGLAGQKDSLGEHLFRGCCIARPPSGSHPGDGVGPAQVPLGAALLQGLPLTAGRGKVSAGRMLGDQELQAGGGDMCWWCWSENAAPEQALPRRPICSSLLCWLGVWLDSVCLCAGSRGGCWLSRR